MLLFTYTTSIQILEQNRQTVEANNMLNRILVNQTREIPLQNQELLHGINNTLDELNSNQELLSQHINQTADAFRLSNHEISPDMRNALYAVAATNSLPPVTHDSFTNQLNTLLDDLNQSSTEIQNLQEQVRNLSSLVPNDTQVEQEVQSAFPFAENRIERADIPKNESMTIEPEGGTIAGLGNSSRP